MADEAITDAAPMAKPGRIRTVLEMIKFETILSRILGKTAKMACLGLLSDSELPTPAMLCHDFGDFQDYWYTPATVQTVLERRDFGTFS